MAIGKIGSFDLDKDNFETYVDRLEQYYVANSVPSEMKVATLITVIGNEAYELMANLCTPEKPASKTYTELVKLMKGHLNPKPSMLAERFKFRQRIQKIDENIACYVAELKKLSKNCGFSADNLKENIRDQFVCGLVNDDIRQKLFTEDDTITLDKALKLALSMEAAETNAALVEDRTRGRGTSDGVPTCSSTAVNRMGHASSTTGGPRPERGRGAAASATRGANSSSGPSYMSGAGDGKSRNVDRAGNNKPSQGRECSVCGGGHGYSFCKYKKYVCRVCNLEGHLKKMCPRLRSSIPVHNVNQEQCGQQEEDEYDSDEVNNFSLVTSSLQIAPYTVGVCIAGTIIQMEIDTGSAISCISYECYAKLFARYKLDKCNLVLRYYTGESVKPMGKISIDVRYQNKCKNLDLYIVECGNTSLLGRYWISELGIKIPIVKVSTCHKVNDSESMSFNIKEFSSRYYEVFADGLGRFTGGTVGFRLREGARPVFLRARPLAYALREPVERALDSMVRDGIISPVTTSDWATPIVPVMKKDGTIRVCADFKMTVNKYLEVDHYPLPKVEDLLAKLHGGEKFTKLDLSQAYAQFELDESKKYTVNNTHKGLFMYNRLIYGLASSPGIFQRKLEQLFADMPRVGVFLDDLIITGVDNESHLATLHEVFQRLNKYGLKIKRDKCMFFAESVTYLGFIIGKEGVHTCPEKIEAIRKAPIPNSVSELRSFLGLDMYYAKFVPNISTILGPLYTLLRKETKYVWGEECMTAFNRVKEMLVSSEILAHYAPDLPLVLTTDASSVGVGAVISHLMPDGTERPVAYASRVLNKAEKAYSQIEREALAIVYGVRKFHQYLYGRKFLLKTDHKPLVTIFGDKTGIPVMAASKMQRWAVILAGYDYSIEYVCSKKNAADALSRLPVGETKGTSNDVTYLNFIQNHLPVTRRCIEDGIRKDDALKKLMLFIQAGWPNECSDAALKPYYVRRNELYVDRGCIIWGYRLVVPSSLRKALLTEFHAGHLGIVKMKSIARSLVWWPGIDQDIEETARRCTTCALEADAPPRAPPQQWTYISEPWSRLHVDFLGPFQGKTYLVIIDASSKWLEIFPMQKTTASAVIKVLRETFARFGLSKEVVSDNGPPFTSREYQEFLTVNGIRATYSPAYHPASNGAAENAVKLCKRAIKKSIRDGCDVDVALQTYLMMYRNVEHTTTGVSPAMLLQRRQLRSRLDLLKEHRQVENRVHEAQGNQVRNAGGVQRDFGVGEKVWARDYAGGKWVGGVLAQRVGSRSYIVGRESGPPVKRHVDQIKKRCSFGVTLEPEIESPVKNSRDDSDLQPVEPQEAEPSGQRLSAQEHRQSLERPVNPVRADTSPQSKVLSPVSPRLGTQKVVVEESPVCRPKRIRKPVKRFGFEFD